MIVYFYDDEFVIVYKNRAIIESNRTGVAHGNLVDRTLFMNTFAKTLKREKVKNKLFGDEITIVKNSYFSSNDLFVIENIFLELGFIKVHFLDIRELLPDQKGIFVEVNQKYMVFYFDKALYLSLLYFKDIPKVFLYLDSFLQDDIILFGTNKQIPNITYKNKRVYILENYNSYLISSLLKVKKCDH